MLHMLSLPLLALNFASAWAAPMCSLRSATATSSASTTSSTSGSAAGGTSTSPPSSGGNTTRNDDIVATTCWSKYTSVTYSFALTTPDVNTVSLNSDDEQLLPQFVEAAHNSNSKAMLTVGGWTGSQYFSSAVGSADNRTAFVNAVMGLVSTYNLDGLDFDWEYPNKQGLGCNIINAQDTPNFLSFLQELRTAAPNLTLSAAASIVPFAGPDGTPSTDVSEFAKVLDYVAIMNYDIWGSWSSSVGPNAPLNDTCAPSADQQGSAVSAVQAWTTAGFPANQLVLGVASYGHSFHVDQSAALASSSSPSSASSAQPAGTTPLAAYPAFDASQQPMGDSWDVSAPAGVDQCGNPSPGGPSGIFNFGGMIAQGILDQNGTAVPGMGFLFDECSQTPFVYVPQNQTMISYDDPQSFAAKGKFINEAGLRGFAMWEAAGDYQDILLDAISNAIGIEEVGC
ncbi:hypothetical protein EW026_g2419 [Hermanssonia centrifuga]|uniref:GH18 domain-containing protein n=1 Tax=Hermanssonia centrifuga TaxID=98765 RepID=A0A4S4KPB7_9APHY|nr:hypothetical protein EW026_g2419 [Hermanssonia centrifuga]